MAPHNGGFYEDSALSDSDSDSDNELFKQDMEALRRACMPVGGVEAGEIKYSSSTSSSSDVAGSDSDSDDSSKNDSLDFIKRMRQKLAGMASDIEKNPMTVKPLAVMAPEGLTSDEEDDVLETFRAIQRRFATYDHNPLKNANDQNIPKQVCASSIPLEQETSTNLFVNETNSCKRFPDFDDNFATSLNLEALGPTIQASNDNESDQFNNVGQLLSLPPKGSNFPTSAQVFIDAIRKNRSCQKLLRAKLSEIESRIEVNQKLKGLFKIFKDFQVSCRRRSGRALSQKKDPRVQLFLAPKFKRKKPSPMNYGPTENSHVANYKMVLKKCPLSFSRMNWSSSERKTLVIGLKQEYQKALLEKSFELLSGTDCIDNIIASINDHEISDENIRSFLPNVDWNYFASVYTKGRSGAECETRWLNYEDPLINNNPWTHKEDKLLTMIVQEKGVNSWIDSAISLGTNRTPFQCLVRYQRSLNPWVMKTDWTKEEDAQLRSAVKAFGESNWQVVASTLVGRTGTQCSNRWKKTLHPSRKSFGRWTREEDKHLRVAVMLFGPKTWSKIAKFVPGRIPTQCRERWVNGLNPALSWARWTEEEDQKLLDAVTEHNYCWSKVATCVPPRTDSQCLRRWKKLCPDDVPRLQADRKIKKTAIISNFVDRESERPTLVPSDFIPLAVIKPTDQCENNNVHAKPKSRRSRKGSDSSLLTITNSEDFDPVNGHVSTNNGLDEDNLNTNKKRAPKRTASTKTSPKPRTKRAKCIETASSHPDLLLPQNAELEITDINTEIMTSDPLGTAKKKTPKQRVRRKKCTDMAEAEAEVEVDEQDNTLIVSEVEKKKKKKKKPKQRARKEEKMYGHG